MTKKLLVVDDEDVLRMLIVDTLEDEGYQIQEVQDGQEALNFIQENEYDLIIIDYMMPEYSGVEVIKKVREMDDKHELQFLMLTAKSQQKDEEMARQAGADYFLAKPFSPLKLVDLVGEILDDQ
ncbi:response regulator [Alkalihalobacterium sp. APHAB7]|uniref:response regulator n=1 Tax=Alkalihalobacterium sp. APHAB7 TaxID=3402081 RepID=UPI003AAC3AD1